jgi:hypothetical protein
MLSRMHASAMFDAPSPDSSMVGRRDALGVDRCGLGRPLDAAGARGLAESDRAAFETRNRMRSRSVPSEVVTTTVTPIEFVLDRIDSAARRVTPTVDGISLIDLVRVYESARGFDVPGGYDGLIIDHFRFGDLRTYLSGRSDVWPGSGRAALLGCNCGDVGCWPLFARVRETDSYVIWDRFEQPHRKDRDYSGFEPFLFDRQGYRDALDRLAEEIGPSADA